MTADNTSNAPPVARAGMDFTDSEAWEAVLLRDRRFDGLFVYAVETTGIYCRPSCPSRRPKRGHVSFFGLPEQASEAGFRACRRCDPSEPGGTAAERAVERARRYVEDRLDETVTLDHLAAEVEMSPYHLQRVFKRLVGLSPKEYQNARRLEAFKNEVGEDRGVLEAALEAGFGSTRALYEQAEAGLGMTPGTYRRGGDGVPIRYTTFTSDFGSVLVAATDRGVCAVSLGDNDGELIGALAGEFPNASLIERDDAALRDWAEPVVRYLDGAHAHPTMPLDLHGTDFQRHVWKTLQKIPYGETRSYSEVADMLGRPSAARAVARACATNKAALVVPCHRVVRTTGELSGYRWGVERKRRLLQQESGA